MTRIVFLSLVLLLPAARGNDVKFLQVSREVIEQRLRSVPQKNEARQAELRRLFAEAGCGGERLTEQPVKRSKIANVVCKLPGDSESVILVGAHFDFAGKGEGVADNWTGAALLPVLFQSLAAHPRKHTFVFIGFTDEEKGLIGSKHYAKAMTPADRARTQAMINLDTLGMSHTRVWASRADPQLLHALRVTAASLTLHLSGVDLDGLGSTDSESFREAKIPSITLHSVSQVTFPLLHQRGDNAGAVDPAEYYNAYRLVATYLAYLDGKFPITPVKN